MPRILWTYPHHRIHPLLHLRPTVHHPTRRRHQIWQRCLIHQDVRIRNEIQRHLRHLPLFRQQNPRFGWRTRGIPRLSSPSPAVFQSPSRQQRGRSRRKLSHQRRSKQQQLIPLFPFFALFRLTGVRTAPLGRISPQPLKLSQHPQRFEFRTSPRRK